MKRNKLLLLNVILIMASSSCMESPVGSQTNQAGSGDQQSSIFSLIQENNIETQTLNSADYKITHLTVGDMPGVSFKMYLPMISLNIPAGADSVELLRCKKDLKIVEDVKRAAMVIQPSPTWATAEKLCDKVVKNGISTKYVIDFRATRGDYHYVGRACVRPERMKVASTSNCSDLISISAEPYHYEDVLAARVDDLREEMARSRDEINAITLRMQSSAVNLNNAQARCKERTEEKERLLNEHNSLMSFLSTGIRVAETLIGGGLTNFNPEKFLNVGKDAASIFLDKNTAPIVKNSLQLASKAIKGQGTYSLKAAADILSTQGGILPNTATVASEAQKALDAGTAAAAGDGASLNDPSNDSNNVTTATLTEPQSFALTQATTPTTGSGTTGTGLSGLRNAIDGMMIKPGEVLPKNQCPGITEVNEKLKADKAQLIANQISLGIMNEAYSNAQAVKDVIGGMGGN